MKNTLEKQIADIVQVVRKEGNSRGKTTGYTDDEDGRIRAAPIIHTYSPQQELRMSKYCQILLLQQKGLTPHQNYRRILIW